jgi:oligoendopeptidase F
VLETFREFDHNFYNLAKKVFDEKHIHSEITENKRGGAYCYSVIKDLTPYILLNHTNKLRDVFTMAHELGHAVHDLAAKDQTEFTHHPSLPLAETASVFAEILLTKKMLKNASNEEKKEILVNFLDNQYSTITRQAYFILFEIEAHKKIKEGATSEELNRLYLENLKEQFGEFIDVPEIFQYEWNTIPHIHETPFYCYAYAFGNLLVLALYRMYEKEGKDFISKYMKILSYGGSESPINILKEVGIDITKEEFWQKGFEIIKEHLEMLENLSK